MSQSGKLTGLLTAARQQLPPALYQRVACGAVAAFVTLHLVGRLGLLPRGVAQAFWVALAPGWIITGRVGAELCRLVGRILRVSEDRQAGWATWIFCSSLAWWQRCCGHLRVSMDRESRELFASISTKRASVMLINHTSFMDALLLSYFAPWSYRANVRVMYMARMMTWPVIGHCFPLGGHFPVYFSKYVDGNFKVTEQQAAVQQEMGEYLRRGGRLMLFPEATVNKNPSTLLTFRVGLFKTLIAEGITDVYILTIKGANKAWPPAAPLGGCPARVSCKLTAFAGPQPGETPEQLATRARDAMQAQLDAMP